MKVLLLEDDPELQGAVERRLRSSGFAVDTAKDIPDAEFLLSVNQYDCLLFDRAVPAGDTITLVRQLRLGDVLTPVLFLTARDAIADRVDGFEAGCDDYLVKPFAMDELIVRVRSLCRRTLQTVANIIVVGGFEMNQARAEVRRHGVLLHLTAKEMCVLNLLASKAGEVLSKTEIIESCWDETTDPLSNTVEVHIRALRRKLGAPDVIKTIRGAGYLLEDMP
jgi:two-component system copper resistance phosphate regulon response regulator CusR